MCNGCNNKETIVEELVNLQTGKKIDMDKFNSLKDNAMLKVRPELWVEWDFEKNDEFGLDVYDVTKGMGRKVWWICVNCSSNFEMTVNKRNNNRNCPYCSGYRVNKTNCLEIRNPKLAKEWHPTLNGNLTPNDVYFQSTKKYWWLGSCGHEWKSDVRNRNEGIGCPICCNKLIVKGINDIWTTNPKLASLLLNHEDGYKYSKGSSVKLNWKCPDCGEIIKNKAPSTVKVQGLSCPVCSDGFSYPEKFMYNLLREIDVDFKLHVIFDWLNNKIYDFYIPSLNMIIETHGGQHSIRGFDNVGGRTLEEEIENDNYKYKMALKNGIKHYIVIDCRYSEMNFIKNSILNSEINNIFDFSNVDWDDCDKKSRSSIHKEILNLAEKGLLGTEISKELKISYLTIHRILKQYGLNYKSKYTKENNNTVILQLDSNMNIIKRWNGLQYIEDDLGYTKQYIKKCIVGKFKMAYGFIWMFENDFYKLNNK